ncbi:MAG: cache domain-containing protein [Firmicutes bacterium]|nr:cache domain-containing protein [Bacillota bacterium]
MEKKSNTKLSTRLLIAIVSISVVGLLLAFVAINIFVRQTIYNNIMAATHAEMSTYATQINNIFVNNTYIMNSFISATESMGRENLPAIARRFEEEYNFISLPAAGFTVDSAFVSTGAWIPDPATWVLEERPWFVDGLAAGGEVAFTAPYVSAVPPNPLILSIVRHRPQFEGGAVFAIDITLDNVIALLNTYSVPGNGYLFLLDNENNIIFHPDPVMSASATGLRNISEFPNYSPILPLLDVDYGITTFTNSNG